MKRKVHTVFRQMLAGGGVLACLTPCYAADQSTAQADKAARTVLDNNLWVSTRADGMAGAIDSLADGDDAPTYNPAGIGGVNQSGPLPAIRHLNFPFIGASANRDAIKLRHDMKGKGVSDPNLTQAILNARADQRQYGRVSFVPSIGISRLYLAYITDTQVAATSQGGDTDLIHTHYRSQSGPGVGFSACDPHQRFCLGAFGAMLGRSEVQGDFTFAEINDAALRKAALANAGTDYDGTVGNVGAVWQMGKAARPKFAVVSHDVGDSKFKAHGKGHENVVQKESLSAAFSVSPEIHRSAWFNFCVQGDDLTEGSTSMEKKMRGAMELTLGEHYGSRGIAGLRVGYASAGASYGLNFNIGMLEFAASSYAVDIGTANNTIIERRYSGIFTANVGEF